MKFPKNRANLYLVERWNEETYKHTTCGAFAHYDDAHDFKEACEQEWLDKMGDLQGVTFEVSLTTLYG